MPNPNSDPEKTLGDAQTYLDLMAEKLTMFCSDEDLTPSPELIEKVNGLKSQLAAAQAALSDVVTRMQADLSDMDVWEMVRQIKNPGWTADLKYDAPILRSRHLLRAGGGHDFDELGGGHKKKDTFYYLLSKASDALGFYLDGSTLVIPLTSNLDFEDIRERLGITEIKDVDRVREWISRRQETCEKSKSALSVLDGQFNL